MFFSTDLLSRRDSGFGLLWLAATLGPKSTFKKLPKTSVMSADITQLCELIATPVEPLALRLSSNLLVGAARVYKVKQEIFMSDVTICFNSLKRVVQDLRSVTTSEALLQMSQPSVRPSAVTLRIDPDAAFAMDLDNRVDWDEYLNFSVAPEVSCTSSDDDYDPKASKSKRKAKTSVIPSSSIEAVRAKAHTLDENLEFLLANSLDTSFGGSGVAMPTSSQLGGFGSDDAFFGAFDGLDIEGIGDDLVRELGEDWGANPTEHSAKEDVAPIGELAVPGYDVADMDLSMQRINDVNETLEAALQAVPVAPPHQNFSGQLVEMSPVSMCSSKQPQESSSPGKPEEIDEDVAKNRDRAAPKKNIKHARVVLDVRIELTDDELKAARIHYLGQQRLIRQESQRKQFEKERQVLINNLLCGIPDNVQAKELIDFWISNYKTRVEARTDSFEGVLYGRALTKCGKGSNMLTILTNMDDVPQTSPGLTVSADLPVTRPSEENGMDFGFDYDVEVNLDADEHQRGASRLRSSEEPGQARHLSLPPSALRDDLGIEVRNSLSSQRLALFPWDNTGNSFSISSLEDGIRQDGSDRMSIGHAETRLFGDSLNHKDSSIPSHLENIRPSVPSPGLVFRGPQMEDDFIFDVSGDNPMVSDGPDRQPNFRELEKNSLNFLEYAKLQYQLLSNSLGYITFDDVVPRATSTAHVAAAAMYHCLALGTKNLIELHQAQAYGEIIMKIKTVGI